MDIDILLEGMGGSRRRISGGLAIEVLYTLKPYTLYPETLNPAPETLDPETLHPACTLKPLPEAPNPKRYALNYDP